MQLNVGPRSIQQAVRSAGRLAGGGASCGIDLSDQLSGATVGCVIGRLSHVEAGVCMPQGILEFEERLACCMNHADCCASSDCDRAAIAM